MKNTIDNYNIEYFLSFFFKNNVLFTVTGPAVVYQSLKYSFNYKSKPKPNYREKMYLERVAAIFLF